MGTRSTVKFYIDDDCILSVYQQYDGGINGVGKQIYDLLKDYKIVNGLSLGESKKVANGVEELVLFYIIDNKKGNGNIYATTKHDSQQYDYEINSEEFNKITYIKVFNLGDMIFAGTVEEYFAFVESHTI